MVQRRDIKLLVGVWALVAVIIALLVMKEGRIANDPSIYTERKDPLKWVQSARETENSFMVHNDGPDAEVISLWYAKSTKRDYCAKYSSMRAGETRLIENICGQQPDDAYMWVLTVDMYRQSNWRDSP